MFTTYDLLEQVRDSVREYQGDAITDEQIFRKLNMAYAFAYNALIKQNDTLFSKFKYITVNPNVSKYELPKFMHSRRIERVYYPVPVVDPSQPINYTEIPRCDISRITDFMAPRYSTYYPLRWTQTENFILFAPPPRIGTVMKMLYTPALIPLANVQGQIAEIEGDELVLDRTPQADMLSAINVTGQNFISITDEVTGELKALYPYKEINGVSVFLGDSFNRNNVKTIEMRRCRKYTPATGITYDPIAKTCMILLNSNPVGYVKQGDTLEIKRQASGSYNITDSLESDTDFYDPPEYSLPDNTFTQGGEVLTVTSNSITWQDDAVVPDFTNGYPTGFDDGTFTGALTTMVNGTYLSQSIVLVTCAVSHGLPIGRVFKLNIAGTGTNCDGTRKCVATSVGQIAILQASFTGTYNNAGTWAMYQYTSLVVTTGWPQIYDVSPGNPKIDMINLFAGSPYTYTAQDAKTDDTPAPDEVIGNGLSTKYDHKNDINPGDYVTLGLSTATPLLPELLAEFLVFYCVITLKSSINETDPKVDAVLREKLMEIKSDNDGRIMNLQFDPVPYFGVNGYGRSIR
jgi:hypothetical protein